MTRVFFKAPAIRMLRPTAAVLAACLAGAPALAASPAADPEGAVVRELVVTAKLAGPAWWRVSSPTSTVFVLGTVSTLPRGLKWDTAMTRRRLEGANALIVPPRVTAGIGDIFALLSIRRHFRSKTPMEDSLPADLRARFIADRGRLNPDPRAYSGWTPLAAGLLMISDFRKQARLERTEPGGSIERLASARGVRIVPAGTYKAVPLLRAAQFSLAASGPPCMADALDEIEAGAGRLNAAGEGWARGDVAVALSAQRGFEKCLASLPEGADIVSKSMDDTTAAIVAALGRSGHSVAIVNLRTLVAQGGVLQRLRAQGYKVVTPDQ